jgi:hypothetical protein
MKTIITDSAKDLIKTFDKQLAAILKEDILKYREENQSNLIDFNTRKYDLELQLILQSELETFRTNNQKSLKHVG